MAPGKSIMFQWEATPPRVCVLDGFINKRKKNEDRELEGEGKRMGPGRVVGWEAGQRGM